MKGQSLAPMEYPQQLPSVGAEKCSEMPATLQKDEWAGQILLEFEPGSWKGNAREYSHILLFQFLL